MSDTTGNQDRTIATNGTAHVAQTMGPTDVCKLPNNVPAPFMNFIKAKGMLHDGTTNTSIVNEPVWIQHSYLGPPSDPAHAGVNKGVASGTYRDIAQAKDWSKDVKMEGEFVVRTNDPTYQNKKNTDGMLLGSATAEVVDTENQYKQKLCTIIKLEGECGHKRKLGPPPGEKKETESNYLEILVGDTVEFISTREDIVRKDKDPECDAGIHTHWEIRSSGGSWVLDAAGVDLILPDKKDSRKKYMLKSPYTGEADSETLKVGETKDKTSKVNDYSRRRRATDEKDAGGRKFSENYGEAITHKTQDSWQKKTLVFGKDAIKQVARFWDAAANPRSITVEATGCSGKKTAMIKCLPKDKIKIDVLDNPVKDMIKPFLKHLKTIEKVAGLLGGQFRFEAFKNAKLNIELEYKELEEDRPQRAEGKFGFGAVGPFYKVQCRRAWALEAEFSPLAEASFEFDGPITAAIPVIGPGAAAILKLIGVKADFFLRAEGNVDVKANVTWNEYDDIVADGELSATFKFSAGVKVFVVMAEATLYAYVEFSAKANKFGPRPGLCLAADYSLKCQIGFKGAAKVTFFFVEYSKDLSYEPEWGKLLDWKGTVPIYKQPGVFLDAGTVVTSGNMA